MNLKEALIEGAEILSERGIVGGRLDAEVLLQYVAGKDRIFFIREPFHVISEKEKTEFFNLINERALGKPVSYITGEKEFMGLPFKVNEDVLIPRPDTEILVEEAVKILKSKIEYIKSSEKKPFERNVSNFLLKVMDMCTGSGAIAVSMGYYVPEIMVVAVDISEKALEIAKKNAKINTVNSRIAFIQSNLFEKIPENEKYEVIVSNPPYIRKADIDELMKDVKDFEPVLALDGGNDGLDFYRRIVPEAALRLNERGSLLLEVGSDQAESVTELIHECGGFCNIRVLKDLAGLDRVVAADKQ